MNTNGKYYIGIDIWGTCIKYLLRYENNVVTSGSYPADRIKDSKDVLAIIFSIIDSITLKYENIWWVGIGSKGRVTKDGIIKSSSFKALAGLDLKNILEKKYKCRVKVINDASLPYYAIPEIDKERVNLFVTLGTGMGTSLFHNGKKIGDETFSSQFSSGKFRQWVREDYASTRFLLDQAKNNNIVCENIYELSLLASKDDATAFIVQEIFKKYGENLGEILSILINDFDVDRIYISWGITQGVSLFQKYVVSSIAQYSRDHIPEVHIINKKYPLGAYGASMLFS